MKIQFFIALSVVALIGCKNNPQEITVAEDAMANTQLAEEQRDKTKDANPFAQGTALSTPATSQGGGVTLNPPHGQPGHRCDIPVGAPLNSKPAAATTAAPAQQPQVVQQQVVIDPQQAQQHTGTTEPGFSGKPNPPHGQPGHRCDIAVGATLP